jgi:acetylornithine deacetylase/succinyl-diaminopimelate desuccinylase-like protein
MAQCVLIPMERGVIESSSYISAELLVGDLRQLCQLPASHEHPDGLNAAAEHVAALMRRRGLKSEIIATSGAPVVIGRRNGRSPHTILLYHHYDTAPPGPWRAWNHEPYQLAERDDALYGRGVASGKGPLVAHLAALWALITAEGELPCNVVVVAEGEALIGSPHFGAVISEHRERLKADVCLASGGERDANGQPICYNGAKGLLQSRLTVVGANHTLAAGLAASVPNPIWRLVWALDAIKSSQEEIMIDGFYDDVESPSRAENQALRMMQVDEAGRLAAWGLSSFLFDMSGPTLVSAESTLPTCNISSLIVDPHNDLATVPMVAMAMLDFQLVPRQRPQAILELLRAYLKNKQMEDVNVERLPGGYPAASTPGDHPFIRTVCEAGQQVYGAGLGRLPLGPFALPLFFFSEAFGMPFAIIGCARHDSATYGPNEHIPVLDLVRHGQILIDVLARYNAGS